MRTVVVGLGNPIVSDDRVGIVVATEVEKRISGMVDVEVAHVYSGGLQLMDALVGFDRALIVDAMVTGAEPGTVKRWKLQDMEQTKNLTSVHDMNLPMAMDLGLMSGLHLPSDIEVWGVEAVDVETFGETLSELVERSVPIVVEQVCNVLEGGR